MENNATTPHKTLIAFVGMPGSGKSEACLYLMQKNIPFVRFGDATEESLTKAGLPITPENEAMMREKLRKDFGMAVYAERAKPKIDRLLQEHDIVGIDGLYSWEEYLFLTKHYPQLHVVYVFASPKTRYQRLTDRAVRPFSFDEARKRDIAEVEKLNKSGPIAIADHVIQNESDLPALQKALDTLLTRIQK
ncbi:MAG: AAA family ATPase [Candidatus Levybacteria bacterium]|nr:AAA family ATPase [Candidatus Levybacteria bacterium]